jgi:hypothetical protein
MLSQRINVPNISYQLNDVNKDEIVLPQPVDHIVIGTAIHWVEPKGLERLIKRNLKPEGKVLVTYTALRLEEQPWFAALARLDAGYGRGGASFKGVEGVECLAAVGFGKVEAVRLRRKVKFNIDHLYSSQISYLYGEFYKNVSADYKGYRKRMSDVVAAHLDGDGKLTGTLINWGIMYGRVES